MNRTLVPILAGLLVAPQFAIGQPMPQRLPAPPVAVSAPGVPGVPAEMPNLTKFDLDFPGGTPGDLVQAIGKASGRPLNAIVPDECKGVTLPALKMKSIDVAQLFDALRGASTKAETRIIGYDYSGPGGKIPSYRSAQTWYGFKSTAGPLSDDTIWYFYVEHPLPLPPTEESKVCRFWHLSPYLEAFKIEDITTAVQTGFKMLGDESPTMNFHKDTKLLIAVGQEHQLKLIDSVLAELGRDLGAPKSSPQATPAKLPDPPKR